MGPLWLGRDLTLTLIGDVLDRWFDDPEHLTERR